MKDSLDPFSKALEIYETIIPAFSTCARRLAHNKKPMNAPRSKKIKIEVRDEFALGVAFLGTTLRKNGLRKEKDIPYIALYDEVGNPKSFAQWANSLFEVDETSMADGLRQRIQKDHLWKGKSDVLQIQREKDPSYRKRRSSSWFEKQSKQSEQEEQPGEAGSRGDGLKDVTVQGDSSQAEPSAAPAATLEGEEREQSAWGSSRRLHLDMSRVNSEAHSVKSQGRHDDVRPQTARQATGRQVVLTARPVSARFPPRDHVRENILSARRQQGGGERPLSWRRQQQAIVTVQTRRQEIEESKVQRIKDTIERRERRFAMIQNDLIKEESERRQKMLLAAVVCSSFFNLLYKEVRKRRETLKSDYQIVREDTERGLRISTAFLAFIGGQMRKGKLLEVYPICARVHKWLRQIMFQSFLCLRLSTPHKSKKSALNHFPEYGIIDEYQAASFFKVASKLDR